MVVAIPNPSFKATTLQLTIETVGAQSSKWGHSARCMESCEDSFNPIREFERKFKTNKHFLMCD